MSIPEDQLNSWSQQGSVAQSSDTARSIREHLDSVLSPYAKRDCISFLQGSYANNTNIVGRDSDVDIVLRSKETYYYDTDLINKESTARFERDIVPAEYSLLDLKSEAFSWLHSKYGSKVVFGNKAISISGEGNRRDADVIPCFQYRKFTKFNSFYDNSFIEGIVFFTNDNTKIINYPKQHLESCTRKHQSTNGYFKPMVRVLKNMRNKAIDDRLLVDGIAPSYFVEGLLYNAPNELFGNGYGTTFVKTINWLTSADKSKFVCANEQYFLLHPTSPVTWRAEKCEAFIAALCALWNNW